MSKSNRPSSSSAWNTIFIRPYGTDLLTSGGKAVLAIMCAVMLIISVVEGAAWGYSLGEGSLIIGIPIAILVFLFMFSLDISLATADLMESRHKKVFSSIDHELHLNQSKTERGAGVFRFFFKGTGGFVIRLTMAIISLWITSDSITQFIFRAEISQGLEKKQNSLVVERIESLKAEKATVLNEIDLSYQQALKKRDEESKTGVGKRTAMLKEDSDRLERERKEKSDSFDKRIMDLSEAYKINDYSGFRKENVLLVADSQTEKGKIISSIEDLPAFKKRHRAVEVLIFMLIFGLVFIKLSQPDHLKLYYSSRLQELWKIYKKGVFDSRLPEVYRSNVIVPNDGEDALPQQFEEIMYLYMEQKSAWDQLEVERLKQEQTSVMKKLEENSFQESRAADKKRQVERDEDMVIEQQRQDRLDLEQSQKEHVRLQQEQALHEQTLQRERDLEKSTLEHARQMQQAQVELEEEVYQKQLQQERQQIAMQKQREEENEAARFAVSYQAHLEKTAKEQALHRDYTKKVDYRIQNLKAGLLNLDEFEAGHKKRYVDELAELTQQDSDKLKQFVSMQKEYATQERQLENKRRSIEKEESELAHLRLLLETARQGEGSHKSHVVQMVIYYGSSISKKEALIQDKKYKLRDFEARQVFFKENCDKVNDELMLIRQKKQKIMEPLDKIIMQRSLLEQECIQLLSDAACVESPYQPFDDAELAYLVSQLKQSDALEPQKKPLLIEYHSS